MSFTGLDRGVETRCVRIGKTERLTSFIGDNRRPEPVSTIGSQRGCDRVSQGDLVGVERHADLCVSSELVDRSDLLR